MPRLGAMDRFLRFTSRPSSKRMLAMFGFKNASRDPLTDIKSAERWLASFPENDPLAMHAALLAELAIVTEQASRRTPARLETLFFADSRAAGLRKTLTAQ